MRGWSTESWVWGIDFMEASNADSRLVNNLKLEEVRWLEVNFKAMLLKQGRESAGMEEEDEETRASIKGRRKGRVGEVEGSSNSTRCSSFLPSLVPPQTAKSVLTNPSSSANCWSRKRVSALASKRDRLKARQCLESSSSK